MKRVAISIILAFIIQNSINSQEKKEMMSWDERVKKAEAWFEMTDGDGDGRISVAEFPEQLMPFWPQANTNGDNYLTWEEELAFQVTEHEQVFIKEMRKEDRMCEIQHQLDGDSWPEHNGIQDVSGEWLCFTTMSERGNPGNGVMYIILDQEGTKLSGELRQLASPDNETILLDLDENGYFKGRSGATVNGRMFTNKGDKPRYNMFMLHRENLINNFQAIFTGSVSADGRSMLAQLTNNNGEYGTMIMIRRDCIQQFESE